MQNYIVLLRNGQAMVFDTYEEAFNAAETYTRMTGNVACVEQFLSATTPVDG